MGNYGKPTLRATIWEAAKDLLHMSPEEFGELSELDQYLRVHDSLKHMPRCSVIVRVNQGSVHINDLIIVSNSSVLPVCHRWSSRGTPGHERIGSSPQATGIATLPWTPSRHIAASKVLQASSSVVHEGVDGEDPETIALVVKRLADAFSSSLEYWTNSLLVSRESPA
ncbi:unnamed protein product [Calypogeia fissa]